MNDEEIKLKLAQSYKILSFLKMDDHTYAHLSARASDGNSFYIYPFGLRFEEVKPSLLLKVSLQGEILEGEEYQYNRTGYIIHGSIYQARADIMSVFHFHTIASLAVSTCKNGLLPISQWALHFYDRIAYFDYNSLALDAAEGEELIKALADKFVMLLRNHGSITTGRTIEEAMFYTYHLEQACKTQIQALSMGEELVLPSAETCKKAVHDLLSFEKNLGERDWQAWVRLIEREFQE